jgi:hypothetical protein
LPRWLPSRLRPLVVSLYLISWTSCRAWTSRLVRPVRQRLFRPRPRCRVSRLGFGGHFWSRPRCCPASPRRGPSFGRSSWRLYPGFQGSVASLRLRSLDSKNEHTGSCGEDADDSKRRPISPTRALRNCHGYSLLNYASKTSPSSLPIILYSATVWQIMMRMPTTPSLCFPPLAGALECDKGASKKRSVSPRHMFISHGRQESIASLAVPAASRPGPLRTTDVDVVAAGEPLRSSS